MIEFRAVKEQWSDSISLYAREQTNGEVFAIVADGVKRIPVDPNLIQQKFLEFALFDNAGQSLFDALWDAGFRPHKDAANPAHVDALKYHLEDMRSLVFTSARQSEAAGKRSTA